jgi:hypothetical protein
MSTHDIRTYNNTPDSKATFEAKRQLRDTPEMNQLNLFHSTDPAQNQSVTESLQKAELSLNGQ